MPRALLRARTPILTIALTYLVSVCAGIVMAHTGNRFALDLRDRVVVRAAAKDPAAITLRSGRRWRAALLDFGRNLTLGAVPDTVGGLALVLPYPVAAYRGWVGGIVSVDRSHASRLSTPRRATYYLVALALQLVPYSLAAGAGINLGWAYLRPLRWYQGPGWHGFPRGALRDTIRIYVVAVPLFLMASVWEFLSPWRM